MSLPCERGRWISSFLAVDVNFSGDPRFLIREDLTLDLPSNVDGSWLFQSSMPIVACGNQTWFVRKSWNITSFIDDFPIKSFAVVVGKFPLLCLTECTLVFFGGLTVNFINFISKTNSTCSSLDGTSSISGDSARATGQKQRHGWQVINHLRAGLNWRFFRTHRCLSDFGHVISILDLASWAYSQPLNLAGLPALAFCNLWRILRVFSQEESSEHGEEEEEEEEEGEEEIEDDEIEATAGKIWDYGPDLFWRSG